MKKQLMACVMTSLIAMPALAEQTATEPLTGHRIGLGYSQSSIDGLELGAGLKLEYGYDINDVFGVSVSYEKYKDSYSDLINLRTMRFGTDIGYAFRVDDGQNTLKPYFALGLNMYEEELLGISYSNSSLYYGIGLRSHLGEHFYLTSEVTWSDLGYDDSQYVGITFGYKF